MTESEMHQDAAILNLLRKIASNIEQEDQVAGIDELEKHGLERALLPSKACHVDADGYVSCNYPEPVHSDEE